MFYCSHVWYYFVWVLSSSKCPNYLGSLYWFQGCKGSKWTLIKVQKSQSLEERALHESRATQSLIGTAWKRATTSGNGHFSCWKSHVPEVKMIQRYNFLNESSHANYWLIHCKPWTVINLSPSSTGGFRFSIFLWLV